VKRVLTAIKLKRQILPILGGLVSIVIVLGVLNLQVVIARIKYVQESSQVEAQAPVQAQAPTATSPTPEVVINNRLYIPKIKADLPVIFDMTSIKESDVQFALRSGVLHYGPTAYPGEKGNIVIFGHSSSPVWAPGDYKFAFTLLEKLELGDVISLTYNDVKYSYVVYGKDVIDPTDISVLDQDDDTVLSLVTCTPVGTSKNRLVISARQTIPDPEYAKPLTAAGVSAINRLPH